MKHIVIIPTFSRPEFLTICLEHLKRATGKRNVQIRVYHDRHHNDSPRVLRDIELTKGVIAYFIRDMDVTLSVREPHGFLSNASNFLQAYVEAYQTDGIDFVHMIEDDVLVSQDYFAWQEKVQTLGDYLCSVAWKIPPTHARRHLAPILRSDNPLDVIETSANFSSIGVCWKREKLALLKPHACEAYYGVWGQPDSTYLRDKFPGSPVPTWQHTEQAGLVSRILLQAKGKHVIAWPTVPRVAHVGVNGYHRRDGRSFSGNLDNRIDDLRFLLRTGKIVEACPRQKELGDIAAPAEVPPYDINALRVAQRLVFDGVYA